jgi:thiamine biosynthesis lipoprotein
VAAQPIEVVVSRLRPLLGTLVAVEAAAPSGAEALAAIDAAFARIADVQSLMRPASPGSDVQRLCAAQPGERVRVHGWTSQVLHLACELHHASGGAFDPCRPLQRGRLRDLELSEDAVLCRAPVALDLGGIAKGFAVDLAIEALVARGCTAGLVNAGGDLRVFGDRVGPLAARTGPATWTLPLTNAALAVSGPRGPGAPAEHCGYYRGTDGQSVRGRWVAVTARDCAVADALCKCAMLADGEELDTLLAVYQARQLVPLPPPAGTVSFRGAT